MKPNDIKFIVVHCSATKPKYDIGAFKIREWHLAKGWADIGYHFVIRRDGVTESGRSIDKQGAHVKGFNKNSLSICLIGGINNDGDPDSNYTHNQYVELKDLISKLLRYAPKAEVLGHRDFEGVTKACPCFDVKEFMK